MMTWRLVGIVSTGLLLPALSAHAQGTGGTLVIGLAQTPRHLNSAVQSGVATGIPAAQIFASPLRYDKDWSPQPYLAESWSVQDGGKTVVLKLVANATFHDGKPITSEDVAFSIMAIKANHPFQSMFAPVERVDTPDRHTAVIRLKEPHPALLLALSPAFCPILPKHVFDDGTDLKTHSRNSAPVGSGPYKVVEFKPKEHIVLDRHPGYFIKGRPKFDRVIFKILSDPPAQVLAFERKEIQYMPWVGAISTMEQLERLPHVTVLRKGGEAIGPIGWLAFNFLRKPFDDLRVRQAISHAIDREFITNKLQRGYTKIATGPIAPGTPFYTDQVKRYPPNLEKANELLDAAGHKKDAAGVRFSLQIDYLTDTPDNSQHVAEYLRPQLRKIGIDAKVRTSPDFPTWAKRISGYDFDVTMDASFNYGDPVIGVHRTYLSTNIRKGVIWSNTQNYVNPRVDELLARATVEPDVARRRKLYEEFQKIVVSDLPVVYVNVWAMAGAADKSLRDVPASIWGPLVPFDTISR